MLSWGSKAFLWDISCLWVEKNLVGEPVKRTRLHAESSCWPQMFRPGLRAGTRRQREGILRHLGPGLKIALQNYHASHLPNTPFIYLFIYKKKKKKKVFFFWPHSMSCGILIPWPGRDRTLTPCIGSRVLNHCITREVPAALLGHTLNISEMWCFCLQKTRLSKPKILFLKWLKALNYISRTEKIDSNSLSPCLCICPAVCLIGGWEATWLTPLHN